MAWYDNYVYIYLKKKLIRIGPHIKKCISKDYKHISVILNSLSLWNLQPSAWIIGLTTEQMFSSWILFLAEQVRKNTPDLSPWHMPWGEKITENHVSAYQVRKTTSSIKNRFIKYFIVANSQEIYVGAFIIPILQTKKISHRWFRPQVMW